MFIRTENIYFGVIRAPEPESELRFHQSTLDVPATAVDFRPSRHQVYASRKVTSKCSLEMKTTISALFELLNQNLNSVSNLAL